MNAATRHRRAGPRAATGWTTRSAPDWWPTAWSTCSSRGWPSSWRFGDKEDSASNSGALHYLAQQPLGGVLVWLIAVGMFLLVVWRLLEVALRLPRRVRRHEAVAQARDLAGQGGPLRRARRGARCKTATGDAAVGKGGTDSTTAKLMDLPGRPAHRRCRRAGDHRLRRLAGLPRLDREVPRAPRRPGPVGQGRLGLRHCSARSATSPRASRSRSSAACSCYAAITHEAEEVRRPRPGPADGARAAVRPGAADRDRRSASPATALFCFARAKHLSR